MLDSPGHCSPRHVRVAPELHDERVVRGEDRRPVPVGVHGIGACSGLAIASMLAASVGMAASEVLTKV